MLMTWTKHRFVTYQRMFMQLRGYSRHAEHVPGKHLIVSDTLSRSPIGRPNQTETFADEVECYVDLLENSRPMTDRLLEQMQRTTGGDRQSTTPNMDGLFTKFNF